MILAGMLRSDRNALICDLAETYGIYDMGQLPVHTVAVLASGLRDNSRIKMKLTGAKASNEILLLAQAVDMLNIIVWRDTRDGRKGRNRPESILRRILTGTDGKEHHKGLKFASGEAFETARAELIKKLERS